MPSALFIRHHLEDNPGLIGEAFKARGYVCDLVMMDASTPTPQIDGYDVLIILGSTSSVNDTDALSAWFGRELELLEEAVRREVPIFGICFGAQALCRLFGGTVERSDAPEIGWYDVQSKDDAPIVDGPWFEFHFDHCSLPAAAELWATSPRAVQAFRIGASVGVQFHPEIDDGQLKEWLAADEDDARELGLDVAALLEETARETPAARTRALELVDLFLRVTA